MHTEVLNNKSLNEHRDTAVSACVHSYRKPSPNPPYKSKGCTEDFQLYTPPPVHKNLKSVCSEILFQAQLI